MYNRTGKQKWTPKGVDKTHPSVDHKIWHENILTWVYFVFKIILCSYLPGMFSRWWWRVPNCGLMVFDDIYESFIPYLNSLCVGCVLLLEVSYWIRFYHFTATWIWVVQKTGIHTLRKRVSVRKGFCAKAAPPFDSALLKAISLIWTV